MPEPMKNPTPKLRNVRRVHAIRLNQPMRFLLPFLLCCLTALAAERPASAKATADKPNIVWIVSEDNAAEYLKLYDPHGAEMPNVEKLAERGLVFDHAFSNAPVCSVARSTLITGCYAPRIGAQFHRRMAKVPMPEGLRMFPAYLRDAGYHCTNNSKEDYNLEKAADVWDQSNGKATWRKRKPGQPFFHVRNFGTTHEGGLHFNPKKVDASKLPALEDSATAPYLPDTKLSKLTREYYLQRHRQLDQQIGALLGELEKDGLLEDTIIFYYGDHGGVLPRSKGYAYESGLHVPLVVTVPEKWKHLFPAAKGERVGGFVSFIDFGPTMLKLAGVEVPEGMDGTAFLGEGVTAADLAKRDTAFGYADRFDEKYDPVRTFRRGRFKYMRSYQPFNPDLANNQYRYKMALYREWRELHEAGKLDPALDQFFRPRAPEALYDLENDPHELNNLAGDPAHRDTLLAMRKGLTAWVKGMPDLSFYPECHLIETAWGNPVAFGRKHQDEIAALVDTADLALLPFAEAEPKLKAALQSGDPWQRYWGLVVCSSFGEQVAGWREAITRLAKDDHHNLVRLRAAECLAILGSDDAAALLTDCLRKADTPAEAVLVLNTMTMLHDGPAALDFPAAREAVGGRFKKVPGGLIGNHLGHLAPK